VGVVFQPERSVENGYLHHDAILEELQLSRGPLDAEAF
jgi:hypothetical protein